MSLIKRPTFWLVIAFALVAMCTTVRSDPAPADQRFDVTYHYSIRDAAGLHTANPDLFYGNIHGMRNMWIWTMAISMVDEVNREGDGNLDLGQAVALATACVETMPVSRIREGVEAYQKSEFANRWLIRVVNDWLTELCGDFMGR